MAEKPPGHPNPKIPRGLAGKIPPKLTPFFKQLHSLAFSLSRSSAVPLTMSPCPGDASSLWMLPWKGPQEKPSGRLLRLRTRRSPSCTARSSSSAGRWAQHKHDVPKTDPWLPQVPGDVGTHVEPRAAGGCPGAVVSGWDVAARRGVQAPHSGAEGAFPIPAPKVTAASGLNGFDYLISPWFNGLDNMLIHYEGCSKMF